MSEKEKLIIRIWNNFGKGKYFRVNNKDGSLPSIKEFEKLISKNAR